MPDDSRVPFRADAVPPALAPALVLLESLQEWVALVDDDRRFLYANAALRTAAGIEAIEQLDGLRFGDAVGCIHARQHRDGCGATEFCTVCAGFRTQCEGLAGSRSQGECRVLREDGSALNFRVTAVPLTVGDRHFAMVTALDTSAEDRRRMLERIFFHDVRNTAGGVVGLAEFLAAREAEAGDVRKAGIAESVSRLAQQLLEEINAQADLAAIENGEMSARRSTFDVADLLAEMTALYTRHPVAEEREIEVDFDWAVSAVHTDRVLLGRVIGNLLKNALEAVPKGTHVTVGARLRERRVEMFVHNPGAIPPEVQLQIFQRSFSTKSAGRGLGTFSVQLIGERVLGGSVGFRSSPQSGTEFWIRLPESACRVEAKTARQMARPA
jgi:signal transduction histidine kinase